MDEWTDFPRMIAAMLGLKLYRVDRGDGVAVPLLVRRGDPYFYATVEMKRWLNDNPPPLNVPATQWRLRIALRNLAEAALENAAVSDDWDRWFEGLVSMMNDSEGIAACMATLPSLPFTPDLPNDWESIRPLKEEYDSAMAARTEERKWEGMPFSALRAFTLTASAMRFENNRD